MTRSTLQIPCCPLGSNRKVNTVTDSLVLTSQFGFYWNLMPIIRMDLKNCKKWILDTFAQFHPVENPLITMLFLIAKCKF